MSQSRHLCRNRLSGGDILAGPFVIEHPTCGIPDRSGIDTDPNFRSISAINLIFEALNQSTLRDLPLQFFPGCWIDTNLSPDIGDVSYEFLGRVVA